MELLTFGEMKLLRENMEYPGSIEDTRRGFEKSFLENEFYSKQTKDEIQLQKILSFLDLKTEMNVLDLGTGTGFLAFPIAENNPSIRVVGLDIVGKTLERNAMAAKEKNLNNIKFIAYDGIDFPFEDESFDMVISRYALHHFPDIKHTFKEISRVIKSGGRFFLCDPSPNDDDTKRFVDEFMQMKKDGHIRFYSKDEWKQLACEAQLAYVNSYESSIRFPRKREESPEFDDIVSRHDVTVVEGYGIEISDDEIWITERVNNMLFEKKS